MVTTLNDYNDNLFERRRDRPYDHALGCIETRVSETLEAALQRVAKELDPNWLRIRIAFRDISPDSCQKFWEGRLDFDCSPIRASMNGPKAGTVDLMGELVRRDIHCLLALFYITEVTRLQPGKLSDTDRGMMGVAWIGIDLLNKQHRIELIPNRTQFTWMRRSSGVVHSVSGERFAMRLDGEAFPDDEDWTRAELENDLFSEEREYVEFEDIYYGNPT